MRLFSSIVNFFKSLFKTKVTTTSSTVTESTTTRNTNRRALCVGINNYPGVSNDLRGCVNDAKEWRKLFLERYHFNSVDCFVDKDVTKKNIKKRLTKLVEEAGAGDVVVFTYSGHGTSVKDTKEKDEVDGKDEAICLYDGNLIDDDIREILSHIKEGVKFTFISDSCHSGTVTRAFADTLESSDRSVPRYLPPEDDYEAMSLGALSIRKNLFHPEEKMNEVLISGCLPTEYSYDATFNGRPMGAFSYNALQILRDTPRITYNDFYKKIRKRLPSRRYPQTPCLEGSENNKNSMMFE